MSMVLLDQLVSGKLQMRLRMLKMRFKFLDVWTSYPFYGEFSFKLEGKQDWHKSGIFTKYTTVNN